MKFDRRSPRAWVVFAVTGLALAVAMVVGLPLRRFGPRPARRRLVLYGHTFAGNLRALVDHAPDGALDKWDVRFLYLDPRRYRLHRPGRVGRLSALNPLHLVWLVRADVMVTSHGPGPFRPLVGGRGPAFVDVWHGVGYHRRDVYLETNRGYDRRLVSSPWAAEVLETLGLPVGGAVATGHGLWDSVLQSADTRRLRRAHDLPVRSDPLVLVAPTWTNATLGEQSPLFGGSWEDALDRLDRWASERRVDVVFRSHLNAGEGSSATRQRVFNRPFTRYPVTVEALQMADVLVTDWSSIGVDFMPLRRPMIYLEVPPPFDVGVAAHLDPDDRPGLVVGSSDGLIDALDDALDDPEGFGAAVRERLDRVERKAAGGLADGRAVERYWAAIDGLAP